MAEKVLSVGTDVLVVDNDLRTITIPPSIKSLGVSSDDGVLRLKFQVPRYCGEFDLSEFKARINYLNAMKLGDVYKVTDMVVKENVMTFSWLVGRFATVMKGKVQFNVCLKKIVGSGEDAEVVKEFNTVVAMLPVLEGLETTEQVIQRYPDLVETWQETLFGRFHGRVDDTLSIEGQAADAAITGKKFSNLVAELSKKANQTDISSPYNFKGSTTFDSIPRTGNKVNDTYYCTDKKCKYTWNGYGWYQSSLDESGYVDELNAVAESVKQMEPDSYKLLYTNIAPNNMINKAKLEPGYYVDTAGVKRASNSWNLSEKIDVTGLTYVYFYGGVGLTCFYDKNDNFISYVNGVSDKIDLPSGTCYLRASVLNEYKDTALIVKYESLSYDEGVLTSNRKGYEEGYIHFTVPVNQTVVDETKSDNELLDSDDCIDVDCILSLPKNYTAFGKPVKLIMMCHGSGQGIGTWKDHEGYIDLVQMFRSRGYAVFDCNGFKNDELGWSFWGNQRGVEAWRKAYKYVTDNYNVEKTFSIYGFSMGGLTAMNLAFQGFPNIDCIALSSPVLNLEACWEDESVRGVLKVLYGLGDKWDDSKVFGNNPYKHIIEFNGVKHCPFNLPPIKIWYGSEETSYGVNKQYAIDMVEAIRNSGGWAQYREVRGSGHEICYGMNHYCNVEYMLYFERYNKTDYIE